MEDVKLFNKITRLDSLKPSRQTNAAFSKLVSFCLTNEQEAISLSGKDIRTLRKLSSTAEEHMERYWAERILASPTPSTELKKFWYHDNYDELVKLEWANLKTVNPSLRKVAFVGGGPFPLTAITLAQKYGAICTVIEKHKENAELSTKLIYALGLEKQINITHKDGIHFNEYASYDLVYVAALVGNTHTKTKHISLIYSNLKRSGLLIARYAHGTRTLIYPPLSRSLKKAIKPLFEVHPTTSILNSFAVLQKE